MCVLISLFKYFFGVCVDSDFIFYFSVFDNMVKLF